MKRSTASIAACVALAAASATPALAQPTEGPWLVRARAVYLDPANKDTIPSADVAINSKLIPEIDISYFFTRNVAAELILTYPQKHDVKLNGTKIGTLKHLPPVLSVQYHFDPAGAFNPYVGVGVNYTRFSSVALPAPLSIEKSSVGPSFQAGADFRIAKGMYLNVDLKKVQIRTDVKAGATTLGEARVDPLLVGVGLGWRF